jgi:putative heme-binding domain-containing protein
VQQVVEAQARLVRRDWDNRWVMAALLSSTHKTAPLLLDVLLKDPPPAGGRPILARLAGQIGVNGSDADLARVLASLAGAGHAEERANVLRALGEGLQNSRRPLQLLWQQPPPQIKDVLPQFVRVFEDAARDGRDEKAPLRQRLAAVELLGFAPTHVARPALAALLAPQQPVEVQFAAVRALGAQTGPAVPDILLKAWPAAAPSVWREIQEVLFARPERLPALLDALAARSVLPQQLDAARVAQLRRLTDPKLRARAERLVAGAVNADRQRIVDGYKEALDLKSDAARGRATFRKVCATCHRLDDAGTEVGPDLRSALRDKSAEQLLVSILDPSREVDRRYTNYLVETTGGRSFSGMIVAETATSITLRRAEKAEDIILRTQIESIADTGKSLMPDGLEQQLTRQELADLIAYLRSIK